MKLSSVPQWSNKLLRKRSVPKPLGARGHDPVLLCWDYHGELYLNAAFKKPPCSSKVRYIHTREAQGGYMGPAGVSDYSSVRLYQLSCIYFLYDGAFMILRNRIRSTFFGDVTKSDYKKMSSDFNLRILRK